MSDLNNILFKDEDLVVIDKPPGYYVHPPENAHGFKIPRSQILLYRLRDHFKKYIYPVHRLDVSTSGLMVFAFSSEAASLMAQGWSHNTKKRYWAVCRGFPLEDQFTIEVPLESDSSDALLEARTDIQVLKRIELPYAVGKKFPTSRYSWIEASLQTGRYHQIRRHLNRISHPVIGDGTHGDSHHNRFFRETLKIPGLCLRAQELSFTHPRTQERLAFTAPDTDKWLKIQRLFEDFDGFSKEL